MIDGNAILLQVDRSRVEGIENGQMAVQLPDGSLQHFANMDEEQKEQLRGIMMSKAPDLVMYVWGINATDPETGIKPPKDITPPKTPSPATLSEWLKS